MLSGIHSTQSMERFFLINRRRGGAGRMELVV